MFKVNNNGTSTKKWEKNFVEADTEKGLNIQKIPERQPFFNYAKIFILPDTHTQVYVAGGKKC